MLITLDSRVFATTRRSPVSWFWIRWMSDVRYFGESFEIALVTMVVASVALRRSSPIRSVTMETLFVCWRVFTVALVGVPFINESVQVRQGVIMGQSRSVAGLPRFSRGRVWAYDRGQMCRL